MGDREKQPSTPDHARNMSSDCTLLSPPVSSTHQAARLDGQNIQNSIYQVSSNPRSIYEPNYLRHGQAKCLPSRQIITPRQQLQKPYKLRARAAPLPPPPSWLHDVVMDHSNHPADMRSPDSRHIGGYKGRFVRVVKSPPLDMIFPPIQPLGAKVANIQQPEVSHGLTWPTSVVTTTRSSRMLSPSTLSSTTRDDDSLVSAPASEKPQIWQWAHAIEAEMLDKSEAKRKYPPCVYQDFIDPKQVPTCLHRPMNIWIDFLPHLELHEQVLGQPMAMTSIRIGALWMVHDVFIPDKDGKLPNSDERHVFAELGIALHALRISLAPEPNDDNGDYLIKMLEEKIAEMESYIR